MGLFFALVLIGAFTAAAYYDLTLITGNSIFSMEPKKASSPTSRPTTTASRPVAPPPVTPIPPAQDPSL